MKIAVTAHGRDSAAQVDSRFGRAEYFVLYDEESGAWDAMPNTQNIQAAHGAGIQAGQNLLRTGAEILITGHVGPKAFQVLSAGKIRMYSFTGASGTVQDAIAAFKAGKLAPIVTA